MFDAAVIGGGVTGTLTARALLRYRLKVCLIEKHTQVGYETSKANSAIIHGGYDCPAGSAKARFNVRGNAMMWRVCDELGVEHNRCGSLVLAFDDEDKKTLGELYKKGVENGVQGLSIIDGDAARELEPNISNDVCAALLCESAGVIASYKLSRRACRSAVENGLALYAGHRVTGIKKAGGMFVIGTDFGEITAKYIINAAGVFADKIAAMAGDNTFKITPRKGEYILYDKKMGDIVSRVIFQTPSKFGKGILVSPTAGGPLLIGPDAVDLDDKHFLATTDEGQKNVIANAKRSVPSLTKSGIIMSFAGLRAISDTDDFIIGWSSVVENLFNAAGIQSPGLSAAPAIAEYIADIIGNGYEKNNDFNPILEETPKALKLTADELNALIQENPEYGTIVCRCETVSKAEVTAAIRHGADDLDSVKQETRAGMGRCQGGFCMPRVLELIAEKTGRPYVNITKNGGDSYILTGETKTADCGGGNI